ncbi:MAG: maleate cis-trans isomerase family protein [Geminicoccaceae bacterium]
MIETSTRAVRLGMLTPSSNTVLEPLTARMLEGLPEVSAHFGRFAVTEISLGHQARGQFEIEPMLDAASLLADARVGVICWNGTSAGWLGLDQDKRLCAAIEDRTGIPACSSVLALAEIFRMTGLRRFGLVTPYLDEIQTAIIRTFEKEGFICPSERHLGDPGNFSFAEVSEETLCRMCREVAKDGEVEAITIFCTNLKGAAVVADMEAELGLPIYDTIATALWSSLRKTSIDPKAVEGWGRLFQELP